MARDTVRDKVHKAVWHVAQTIANGTYESDTPMPIYAERKAGLTPVVHRKQIAELSHQSMRVVDDTLITLAHSPVLMRTTGPFYNTRGARILGRPRYQDREDIRAGYTFVMDFPGFAMEQWPDKHRPSRELQKATAEMRQLIGR
jgi:hypothetical protein